MSEKLFLAQAMLASSSSGSGSQFASMPSRMGALRSPKALSSAPTRPMAPPWNQTSMVEWSEGAASACSMRASITPSPSPSTFTDFQ